MPLSLITSKNSQYFASLMWAVTMLRERGIIHLASEDFLPKKPNCDALHPLAHPLHLKKTVMLFLIVLLGHVLACIVFSLEMLLPSLQTGSDPYQTQPQKVLPILSDITHIAKEIDKKIKSCPEGMKRKYEEIELMQNVQDMLNSLDNCSKIKL